MAAVSREEAACGPAPPPSGPMAESRCRPVRPEAVAGQLRWRPVVDERQRRLPADGAAPATGAGSRGGASPLWRSPAARSSPCPQENQNFFLFIGLADTSFHFSLPMHSLFRNASFAYILQGSGTPVNQAGYFAINASRRNAGSHQCIRFRAVILVLVPASRVQAI